MREGDSAGWQWPVFLVEFIFFGVNRLVGHVEVKDVEPKPPYGVQEAERRTEWGPRSCDADLRVRSKRNETPSGHPQTVSSCEKAYKGKQHRPNVRLREQE